MPPMFPVWPLYIVWHARDACYCERCLLLCSRSCLDSQRVVLHIQALSVHDTWIPLLDSQWLELALPCFAFALPLLCLLEPELKVVARSLCSYFCLAVRSQLLEDANVRRRGPCSFACSTAKVRFENIWIDLAWFGIFSGSAIRYYPWLDAVRRAASGRGGSCQLALLFGNGFLCAVEINSPQHSAQSPKFHLVLSHGFTMFHHVSPFLTQIFAVLDQWPL